jgi:predicted acyl esterase
MTHHTFGARTLATAAMLPLILAVGACSATPSAEVATDTDSVTRSGNDRVPEGASWTQHYFPSSDGSDVELHADVLLPEGLEEGEEVPVILSVGAYFGHAGQMSAEGFDYTGPSDRFNDFIEGTNLFDEGYAFVMVDQRGFGGSTGCQDVVGAGEQADVAAAIDWAAAQPWSTGSVGMYGKSFDAITGLVGNNLDQDALKAVVAQEPIWDMYRNTRSNGVPRSTVVDVPTSYRNIAALPALPDDDERYRENAEANPTDDALCAAGNLLGFQTANTESEFWKTRDLSAQAAGTDTPLLITQGFLEWNTEAEGIEEFLSNHEGPQRGWLGQWDHVRGNDRDEEDRLKMGREGWFDETLSFYNEYLKGEEPTGDYPAYVIQDSTGAWRAQDSWPEPDTSANLTLGGGSYLDDGDEGDPAVDTGNSFVVRSNPAAEATRLTGTPRIELDASGHGNVMVRLFDVAPDGTSVSFDEQVSTLTSGTTSFELRSTDWTLEAGHVLAVEIGAVHTGSFGDWIDTPSMQTIDVNAARLNLALDDPATDVATEGDPSVYLEQFIGYSTYEIAQGETTFTLPAPRA